MGAAYELSQSLDVEMPITEAVAKVLSGDYSVEECINELLLRVPDQE